MSYFDHQVSRNFLPDFCSMIILQHCASNFTDNPDQAIDIFFLDAVIDYAGADDLLVLQGGTGNKYPAILLQSRNNVAVQLLEFQGIAF
jgi:hypothetical protein